MTTTTEKGKRERKVFGALEKSQAVLSLWSGRRKPSAICRGLGIASTTLDGWQRRAVKGMMAALGPGERTESATGLELSKGLEQLVGRALVPAGDAEKKTESEETPR